MAMMLDTQGFNFTASKIGSSSKVWNVRKRHRTTYNAPSWKVCRLSQAACPVSAVVSNSVRTTEVLHATTSKKMNIDSNNLNMLPVAALCDTSIGKRSPTSTTTHVSYLCTSQDSIENSPLKTVIASPSASLHANKNSHKLSASCSSLVHVPQKRKRKKKLPKGVCLCVSTPGHERYGVRVRLGKNQHRIGSQYCDVQSAHRVAQIFKRVARANEHGLVELSTPSVPWDELQQKVKVFVKWKTEIAEKTVLEVLVEWLNRHHLRPKTRTEPSSQQNIKSQISTNVEPKMEQQSMLPVSSFLDFPPNKTQDAENDDITNSDWNRGKVQPFSFINQILRKCDSQMKRSGMDVFEV